MSLYDVKVGDKVLEWKYSSHQVREVTRVTKTQIVLGHLSQSKYRKSDGHRVGESYSRSSIRPITDAEIVEREQRLEEAAQLDTLRREVSGLLAEIKSRNLNKAEAEELICFLTREWKQGI